MLNNRLYIFLLFALSVVGQCMAQRYINPVDQDKARPIVKNEEVEEDTVPKMFKKLVFTAPRYDGLIVGVNIYEPLARALGQSYASYEVSLRYSLHNWILPVIEGGVGSANNTPEEGDFTYKCKLSPFFRVGLDYNFLYAKNPAYSLYLGLRYGFSTFKYDITNITQNSGYWGESAQYQILNQSSLAHWGEVLIGLRVKVVSNLYLGWSARMRFLMSYKQNENSDPWYIPGYGPRKNKLTPTFEISWKFDIPKKKAAVVDDKLPMRDATAPNDSVPGGKRSDGPRPM